MIDLVAGHLKLSDEKVRLILKMAETPDGSAVDFRKFIDKFKERFASLNHQFPK